MEFTLTEAQQDLSGLTRSVVTELVTNDRLRELDAAEDRFDAILWERSGLGRRPRCGPSGVGRRETDSVSSSSAASWPNSDAVLQPFRS